MLPSEIGLLTSLEVLDLQGTELFDLPDTVCELSSLKTFKVSFYGSVDQSECKKLPKKFFKDGIISSLPLLEKLGIFVFPGDRRWTVSVSDITKDVTRLTLSAIYFHFPELESLEYFLQGSQSWKNGNLTHFNFIVGHDFEHPLPYKVIGDVELMHISSERCLRFVNGDTVPQGVMEALKQAYSFYLDHHFGICYLSQFGIDNMDALKICILNDCTKVQAIIHLAEDDCVGQVILPALEHLSLNRLRNLESLVAGPLGEGSFGALRCLRVHICQKLSFLFTCSMMKYLLNLEEFVIMDCPSLKYIVIQDDMINGDVDTAAVGVGEFIVMASLKVVKLQYLPNMIGIGRSVIWPNVEYMSFYNCPKLKNLEVTIDDAANVKGIASEKAWWDSLEWSEPALPERLDKVFTQIQHGDFIV